MPTYTDDFSSDNIAEHIGTEVTGGELINADDYGTVAHFNGSSNYFRRATANFAGAHSSGSIAAWVYIQPGTVSGVIFMSSDEATSSFYLRLWYDTTIPRGFFVDHSGTGTYDLVQTGKAEAVGWHHVVLVSTGATWLFYIDGDHRPTTTINGSNSGDWFSDAANRDNIVIGASVRSTVTNYFAGYASDVRVYSQVLTAEEISGLAKAAIDPGYTPLGWWKLDDGSGDAADSSGNSLTLTNTNSVTWGTTGTSTYPSYFTTRGRASTGELFSNATSYADLNYIHSRKPGGRINRVHLSDDNFSTVVNAGGDDLSNSGGYSFDGVNDDIRNTTAGQLDSFLTAQAGGDLTFEVWLKTNSSSRGFILEMSSTGGGTVPLLHIETNFSRITSTATAGVISAFLRNGNNDSTSSTATIGPALYDGEWHHIVWVKQSNTVHKFYFDGVPLTTTMTLTAFTLANMGTGQGAFLGSNAGIDFFQPGHMDNAHFYTGEPTDAQVWDAFSSGSPIAGLTSFAHYKMDGNANDSSGNGYHATTNGVTAISAWHRLPAFGNVLGDSYSLDLDGVNDTLTESVFDFRSGDSSGSISAWIYVESTPTTTQNIFGSTDTASSNRYLHFSVRSSGKLTVFQNNAGTAGQVEGDEIVAGGRWHHVVCTSTGTAWKLYLNGRLQTLTLLAGSNSGNWFADTDDRDKTTIGYRNSSSGSDLFFDGIIANVSIHSAELSADQIYTDMINGYPSLSNLTNWWVINDNSATVADSVGSNDLSNSGGTWIRRADRPMVHSGSTSESLDISGSGLGSSAYVRFFLEGSRGFHIVRPSALTSYSIDYSSGVRLLPLLGVGT